MGLGTSGVYGNIRFLIITLGLCRGRTCEWESTRSLNSRPYRNYTMLFNSVNICFNYISRLYATLFVFPNTTAHIFWQLNAYRSIIYTFDYSNLIVPHPVPSGQSSTILISLQCTVTRSVPFMYELFRLFYRTNLHNWNPALDATTFGIVLQKCLGDIIPKINGHKNRSQLFRGFLWRIVSSRRLYYKYLLYMWIEFCKELHLHQEKFFNQAI